MKKVKAIRVGDPLDPDIHMGAVISEDHLKKVLGFVDIARQEVSCSFALDPPDNKKRTTFEQMLLSEFQSNSPVELF